MIGLKPTFGVTLATLLLLCSPGVVQPLTAGQTLKFTGGIAGEVKNAAGVAQMGAAVTLYNRYDRSLRQVMTDTKGVFNFPSLMPDLYSIRVSLSSFVPAFKRNISVQPGTQSMLTINLAGMLSSVELVSATPTQGTFMAPDYKWVLRSAQTTRPVLRFLDEQTGKPRYNNVFSETRGILKVSAGDGEGLSGPGSQPDLGTAFALATSLFGSNQLQFSGNVGYASRSALPTAGFRTTYSHSQTAGTGPEITVTMRQVALPSRGGFGFGAGGPVGDGPQLRTLAASVIDEFTIMDNVRVEYGMSVETVSLVSRLNTISPFGRLTWDMGGYGSMQVAFSAGDNAMELSARSGDQSSASRDNSELQHDLSLLAALPRVSIVKNTAKVQRTDNLEVGYRKVAGSRTYNAGVFREQVTNGALTMAGPEDLFTSDILPDLGSRSGVFNIGNYQRWGYLASVSQRLGDKLEVAVVYGRGGALTADGQRVATNNADDLRSLIKIAEKNWASARVSGTMPVTGTHFAASYGWADYRSLMPSHNYMTQTTRPDPGLNISIRQPIPTFGLMPGRFEATAEMRNLLEQGYLPMTTVDGRMVVLTNSPRALRGGFSFIF